jgi:hypothetical protein
MKNPILSKIVIGIVIASFIGVFFVMSIIDLTNKKDVNNVSITEAYELLVVENSINGLIPTGKDYYYLGYCEDNQKQYVIHGGKNWLETNFETTGIAKNENGISIHALAKRAGDYDIEKELESRKSQIEDIDSALGFGMVLELDYIRNAILRILAGVIMLAVIVCGIFLKNAKKSIPIAGRRIFLVVAVISLVFALSTIL